MSAAALRGAKSLIMTPRRLEILRLIAAGNNQAQISSMLNLNFYTVRDHIRLLRRAGLIGSVKSDGTRRVSRTKPKAGSTYRVGR